MIKVCDHERVLEYDPVPDVPPGGHADAPQPGGDGAPPDQGAVRRHLAQVRALSREEHETGLDGAIGRLLGQPPEAAVLEVELLVPAQVSCDHLQGDGHALEGHVGRERDAEVATAGALKKIKRRERRG